MKAYHFLKNDMKAGSGDEKEWIVGEKRTIKGEIIPCRKGYHSCKSWLEALQYAPGAMACIVEISGKTIKYTDKQVSSVRKLIAAKDATTVLMEFDIDCAEHVLPNFERYYPKDDRPRKAIEAARQFNKGLITKEELSAAESAAESAARSAAGSAAESAAESAAMSAARSAARSAAGSAAWSAAESAAMSAAVSAAWSAARSAAGSAAWSAAVSAAGSAEIKWQKNHLAKLMKPLFAEVN